MVLESLFSTKAIIKHPIDMFFLTIVITFISIYISSAIFPEYSGVIIPLFVTIGMAPLLYRVFSFEEELEREEAEHKIKIDFLERHGKTILLFTLFFIGNFLVIFFVSIFSQDSFVLQTFKPQIYAITAITSICGLNVCKTKLSCENIDTKNITKK